MINKTATYTYNDTSTGIQFEIFQSYETVEIDDGDEGGSYYNVMYEFKNTCAREVRLDFILGVDPVYGGMTGDVTVEGFTEYLSQNTRYDGTQIAAGLASSVSSSNSPAYPSDILSNFDVILAKNENIVQQPDYIYYGNAGINWEIMDGTGAVTPQPYNNAIYCASFLNNTVASGGSYKTNFLLGMRYPLERSTVQGYDSLWIQSGTRSNSGFFVPLCDATVEGLGLDRYDISTRENAQKALAMGTIDAALEKVNAFNARFGAYHQRMEMTEEIRLGQIEDQTAAESVIRDANMAKEMTDFTKCSVLAQAAQAMMAQANQNAGNVIRLLQ